MFYLFIFSILLSSCLKGGSSVIDFASDIVGLEWDQNQTVDMGDISVGSALTQTFTIYNKASYPALSCNSAVLSDSLNFSIQSTTCGSTIPANGSCTVEVQANPQSAGSKNVNLSIQCLIQERTFKPVASAVVQGLSTNMFWSPDNQDFGAVGVGVTTAAEEFVLTNNGAHEAVGCGAPSISNSSDFIIDNDTCGTSNLAAGSSCSVFVKARPQTIGAKYTTISRTCSNTGIVSTQINQIRVDPVGAILSLSPLNYNYGQIQVGAPNEVFKFTFENTGFLAAAGCGLPTLSNVTDFSILNEDCGVNNLAVGTSCSVWVKASPTSVGVKATTLSRTCDHGGLLKTDTDGVSVTGISTTYSADWQQEFSNANLGVVSLGKNSSEMIYFYRNTTVHPLTGCTVPSLTNNTDFTLTNYTCSAGGMAAASSCFVTVKANPQSAGNKLTTLSRSCVQPGTSAAVNLSFVSEDESVPLVVDLRDVKSVNSQSSHTCAVMQDQTVKCWGTNGHGQLGDGTYNDSSVALPVDQLRQVSSIRTLDKSTCALIGSGTDGGKIKCWGSNDDYWGDGSTDDSLTPVVVSGIEDVVQFGSSADQRCVLIGGLSPDSGKVKCWGKAQLGSLGDGTTNDRTLPVFVNGLSGVTQLAVGRNHSCALLLDQTVRCWGKNNYGQLGDGTNNVALTPTVVMGLSTVVEISAGEFHTCAILSNGSVNCWGSNSYGALGDGTSTTRNTPVLVQGGLANIISTSVGSFFGCALSSNGSVYCWGYNAYYQLGDQTNLSRNTPVLATANIPSVKKISAGSRHMCVKTDLRDFKCWGDTNYTQLGDGKDTFISKAVLANGISDVVQISPRVTFACVLIESGEVKCWGSNLYGYLGDGTTVQKDFPALVAGGLTDVDKIAGGQEHTCALIGGAGVDRGKVKCWGKNTSGQLGDGTTNSSSLPVLVGNGLVDVIQISAGTEHACALIGGAGVENGKVKCWGKNNSGQLGIGTNTSSSLPVLINEGLSNVDQISMGEDFSCALMGGVSADQGQVKCWGLNSFSQLGDLTKTNRNKPVYRLSHGLSDAVYAGLRATCTINQDKNMLCTGYNYMGWLKALAPSSEFVSGLNN